MTRQPATLKYAETHEWVDVDGDVATIGISAFAIEQLNDLVFMELPEVGRELAVGDEFGEVESVKAVSPLYCPVAGVVVEVHESLPNELEGLGEDPYEGGWIMKVKLADGATTDHLMDEPAYQKQCAESS